MDDALGETMMHHWADRERLISLVLGFVASRGVSKTGSSGMAIARANVVTFIVFVSEVDGSGERNDF